MMQPFTGSPREALTAAQIVQLIRDDASVSMGYGAELISRSLTTLRDISDVFKGGSVTRSSYADLHGSAVLGIGDNLDWGSALIRPYITMTSPSVTARFNMGAYFTSTPKTTYGRTPIVHEVDGIDILDGLRDQVGESYSVPSGTSYLSKVEEIILGQGYPSGSYLIDQSSAASILPTDRTWAIDENPTWSGIVNDLLSSIGYMGVWSDWDGRLRITPYISPSDRPSEWTYDTGSSTSMLGPLRTVERDTFNTPNRWIFYRSNNIDSTPPVEGNGLITIINLANGPTSISGRGRTITKVVPLDVADQGSLVTRAAQTVDADISVQAHVELPTWPNPLHWHFDRVTVNDSDLGPTQEALVTKWTLALDGRSMSQEWTLL